MKNGYRERFKWLSQVHTEKKQNLETHSWIHKCDNHDEVNDVSDVYVQEFATCIKSLCRKASYSKQVYR